MRTDTALRPLIIEPTSEFVETPCNVLHDRPDGALQPLPQFHFIFGSLGQERSACDHRRERVQLGDELIQVGPLHDTLDVQACA